MQRGLKQFLFGFLYLLIISAISFGIYSIFLRPRPSCTDGIKNQNEEDIDCGGKCGACEIKELDVEVVGQQVMGVQSIRKTSIMVVFRNPSLDYWVRNFSYKVDLYNILGVKVSSFEGVSSIPPNGKRIIPIAGIDLDPRDAGTISVKVTGADWSAISDFSNVQVSSSNVKAAITAAERIKITGTMTNSSPDKIAEFRVGAVIYGKDGVPKAVSQTLIENFEGFSKRDFEIFAAFEKGETIDLQRTEIFTEVLK